MQQRSLLVFLFCIKICTFLSVCPQQCICSNGTVVCTCDSTQLAELKISSLGGSYIHSFVVHSCASVTLLNSSFSGVSITEKLSFIDIGRLIIEPNAFHGIVQSPRQIIFEKCNIPVLMSHAFLGLTQIEHIWFKQTDIHSIERAAFALLQSVNYLYFRETKIEKIKTAAFSDMYNIRNVFFSGGTEIGLFEAGAFHNSTAENIVMDDVKGRLDQLFLRGVRVESVSIRNSHLALVYSEESIAVDAPAGELSLHSSRFNYLSNVMLQQFKTISIHDSKIIKLLGEESHQHNSDELLLQNCTIEEAGSYSLSGVDKITLTDCVVKKITAKAIVGSMQSISFRGVKLSTISPQFVMNATLDTLNIEDSSIVKIPEKGIVNSLIERFTVTKSVLEMNSRAFHNSHIQRIQVADSQIATDMSPFDGSQVDTVVIDSNDFTTSLTTAFFKGIASEHLEMSNNSIKCRSEDCSMNALLITNTEMNIQWKFRNNYCRNRTETVCIKPSESNYGGLFCRQSGIIAECSCTQSVVTIPPKQILSSDALIQLIGDCDELIINGSPSILLYVYRVAKVQVNSFGEGLRAFTAHHMNLVFGNTSARRSSLTSLAIHNSHVTVTEGGLSNLRLSSAYLNHSYVATVDKQALSNTSIDKLVINHSRVGNNRIIAYANDLHVTHSQLFESASLNNIRTAKFANNIMLCCCTRLCENYSLGECSNGFPGAECPANTSKRIKNTTLIPALFLTIFTLYK